MILSLSPLASTSDVCSQHLATDETTPCYPFLGDSPDCQRPPLQNTSSTEPEQKDPTALSQQIESSRALPQSLPLHILHHIKKDETRERLTAFVIEEIPTISQKIAEGNSIVNRFLPGKAFLKYRYDDASHQQELTLRHLACEGGITSVFQRFVLSGNRAGEIEAYSKSKKKCESYTREMLHSLEIQSRLSVSPFILPMRPEFKKKDPQQLKGIVSPWCDGGDLSDFSENPINQLKKTELLRIVKDVVLGLAYMHSQNICHMDMKRQNIVLQTTTEGLKVQICDFGKAVSTGSKMLFPVSTRPYTSPEQLAVHVPSAPSMDMWSFGLLLFEVFHGFSKNPFIKACQGFLKNEDFTDEKKLLVIAESWKSYREVLLKNLKNEDPIDRIVIELLNMEPKNRPTATHTAKQLEDIIAAQKPSS